METIIRINQYILGGIFLISSIAKLAALQSFATEIAEYSDAYLFEWLIAYRNHIAIIVCLFELLMGIFAITDYMKVLNGWLMFSTLTFFVWLTGINYFSPDIGGSVESCGCFGELIHLTPASSFIKSIVLWGLSLYNLIYHGNLRKLKVW